MHGRLEMPPAPRQGPHVRVSAHGRSGQLSAVAAVPPGGQDSIDHRRVTRQQARQLVARGRQMPPSYALLRSARAAGRRGGESEVVRCAAGWRTGNTGPGPGDVTAAGERELGKELRWKACTAGEAGWDPGQACATQTCLEVPPTCRGACQPTSQQPITELSTTNIQLNAHGQ